MTKAISFLLPPTIALVLAMALRVFAKDRADRVGLLPVAAALLVGWVFLVRPGWVPVDDVRRVAHVAVGGALLGLALDAVKPHRVVTAILVALYLIGCAYASVSGVVVPNSAISLMDGLLTGFLAIIAFLALARFDAMRARSLSLCILLMLFAGGLAALAAIVQDASLVGLSLVLAGALAGYLIFIVLTGAVIGDGIILIAGTPLLAIVWALAQRHPEIGLALLCLPLVLFAETTALRVPLPTARISALLYPVIFGGFVSLPLGLAALIAFVTSVP